MKSKFFQQKPFMSGCNQRWGSCQVLACAQSNVALIYSNMIELGSNRNRWAMFWSNSIKTSFSLRYLHCRLEAGQGKLPGGHRGRGDRRQRLQQQVRQEGPGKRKHE